MQSTQLLAAVEIPGAFLAQGIQHRPGLSYEAENKLRSVQLSRSSLGPMAVVDRWCWTTVVSRQTADVCFGLGLAPGATVVIRLSIIDRARWWIIVGYDQESKS